MNGRIRALKLGRHAALELKTSLTSIRKSGPLHELRITLLMVMLQSNKDSVVMHQLSNFIRLGSKW